MTARRRIPAKERLAIFARADGRCHLCGEKIDGGRERWDVEHVVALELGGDEAKGSDNLQPAHAACHRAKTREDAGRIAKAKRQEQRSAGVARVPKRKIPGSRGTKWKAKIGGGVVLRESE